MSLYKTRYNLGKRRTSHENGNKSIDEESKDGNYKGTGSEKQSRLALKGKAQKRK